MAEDNGGSPLPRRVPGATESRRPPRVEQQVLPESVRQRLLMVIAQEQERAAREPEAPPPEEEAAASQARPTARGGTGPPRERTPSREEKAPPRWAAALGKAGFPHKADHPEPVAPAEQIAPLRWQPPRADDGPTRPPETTRDIVPAPPSVVRADALTEPFLRFSAPVKESPRAPVNPGVTEAAPRPEPPAAVVPEALTVAVPDTAAAPVPDTPAAFVPDTTMAALSDAPTFAVPAAPAAPVPDTTMAKLSDAPTVAVPAAPAALVPDPPAAAVSAPHGRRVNGQQADQGQRRPGRRYRAAGVLFSVAALITVGSLAWTLHDHSAATTTLRSHRQRPAPGAGQVAVRNQAAAWVAAQIGRTTIVSADSAMCRELQAHGVSQRDLYALGPDTANLLRSAVIVATPAVRAQFGTLLNSAYAPAVLASFGSGRQRVDIREVATRGAAAYRSMLAADLAARKSSAAELLRSNRITVSPTARRQLSAGQVDSRLQIMVAAMAAERPIYIVAFNSFAPGADANMPLRFADLTQASSGYLVGSRPVTPAFVRSMAGFLREQPAPYRPLRVKTVRLAGGHTVLRVGFAAPSPLGLLG
jgi:hypothetical protein